MSAFCRICVAGLSALPLKLCGAARSAASRIAVSEIATGASTTELRDAGGSGGKAVSAGALIGPLGDSQSRAFRLAKKDIATTTLASRIVFGRNGRRIVPPD
jgi:hypothetical protein